MKEGESVSLIDPIKFNYHQITAEKTSGFIDFLIPYYPKKMGKRFETVFEDQREIIIKELPKDIK